MINLCLSTVKKFAVKQSILRTRARIFKNERTRTIFISLPRLKPNISTHLQPVENVIRNRFLPSIFENRHVSDEERELITLPVIGGLGVPDITKIAEIAYGTSRHLT